VTVEALVCEVMRRERSVEDISDRELVAARVAKVMYGLIG
jgi:hypothetical protein